MRMYELTEAESAAYEALAVAADNLRAEQKKAYSKRKKLQDAPDKVLSAMIALVEINAKDLDVCSVKELAQFQYWLQKHQGSIFVKTIGRLATEK